VDFPVSSASVRNLHGHSGHYSIFPSRISAGSQDAYRIFDLIELRFCFFKFTRRHTLEGPYLPLVVQEAAGLPLDSSFAEQKKILVRCNGLFYGCADGAEARRFNRMLINAGLITNL
jgi:hypothetical protein